MNRTRLLPIPPSLRGLPERDRPYRPKDADYTMGVSFRDPEITSTTIATVSALAKKYTVAQLAEAFGYSIPIIYKMLRCSKRHSPS